MKNATSSKTYVAFLRGINVGGNKPVKMEALKKAFESLGFENVRTILASGNVLFGSPEKDEKILVRTIEQKLEKAFGHPIGVVVRSIQALKRLMDANPFKGIRVTPQTRLYVTFLSEKPKAGVPVPEVDGFKIVHHFGTEICSVLTLSPGLGTTDFMGLLEKAYGRGITTRNWNTFLKILKA